MTEHSRVSNAERQAKYRRANGHQSIGVTSETRLAIERVQALFPSKSKDAIVRVAVLHFEQNLLGKGTAATPKSPGAVGQDELFGLALDGGQSK